MTTRPPPSGGGGPVAPPFQPSGDPPHTNRAGAELIASQRFNAQGPGEATRLLAEQFPNPAIQRLVQWTLALRQSIYDPHSDTRQPSSALAPSAPSEPSYRSPPLREQKPPPGSPGNYSPVPGPPPSPLAPGPSREPRGYEEQLQAYMHDAMQDGLSPEDALRSAQETMYRMESLENQPGPGDFGP
jgi:hypothetical protein